MKRIITILLVCFAAGLFAQNAQVQNAYNYLRNKEYDKAKAAADAAAQNESTKTSAKLWMYRGQIYTGIYQEKDEAIKKLDNEAEEKALESFITCLNLDKGKDIYKDQVKGLLVQSASATLNKAIWYKNNKEYDKAIHCYELLQTALPYDFDQSLKRNNITNESLTNSIFRTYASAGNKEKTKEYAQKLIDAKYKDANLYIDMIRISLNDKDTAAALNYIEKGKLLFEDNMDIINQEINIYLARNKTEELKTKLQDAINVSPDNEVLHAILATVYQKSNDTEKAEQEYVKALEIKPDYEVANYNLGVLYFNMGNQWNEKLNNLPPKETAKAKEYQEKANDYFKRAVANLEKSYEVSPDKATKQRLRQLLLRLGETEKAEKYK